MFRGGQGLLLPVPNDQPRNLRWKLLVSHGQEGMSSGSGCTGSPLAWWQRLISSAEFMKAPSSLFSPLSPPCSSLLGVGVLTAFGVHHLVRVMPGRKSSLAGPRRSGRLRGRAFGRESKSRGRKRGERGGDAACALSSQGRACLAHASPDVPRLEAAPECRRGFAASRAMRLRGKSDGAEGGFAWAPLALSKALLT